jgi:ATP-dependent Lon protease
MSTTDSLDHKLNEAFVGRVVRKDLLQRVKKGTNVPSFVLEFLLSRYCATDDVREIEEGLKVVLETLQRSFVGPDEANRAQISVNRDGRKSFIDKIHVTFNETEKRTWGRMENFGSGRIAINERFHQNENERIYEGGIWAECTVAANPTEDDDYAFFIEDLKPIQMSRFDFDAFIKARAGFTTDEWMDVLIRSFGLEPSQMTRRLKFHYLARLFPLVESNYNYIELGPRGNGKSYSFSEFSPYSTLLGAPTSASTLWWNAARKKPGLIGFWDVVAFDEVGEGVVVKDRETFQIMKQYMANGNFTRGSASVTANASMVFLGNIDDSVQAVVNSREYNLFKPLHAVFDLAIQDRFHYYVPGWEIPKAKEESLTKHYGLIIEYLAATFHHLARRTNRFAYTKAKCQLGEGYAQRDQTAVLKTVCALLKLLHPDPASEPTPAELDEYLTYAVEGRRRVKEQLNKLKPDDEFAQINLGFIDSSGQNRIVYCPESKDSPAVQRPTRSSQLAAKGPSLFTGPGETPTSPPPTPPPPATKVEVMSPPAVIPPPPAPVAVETAPTPALTERHYRIHYGAVGYSYQSIMGVYLPGAKEIVVEDAYIRHQHQIRNFLLFCELAVRLSKPTKIKLVTKFEDEVEKADAMAKLATIGESLKAHDVEFTVEVKDTLHDRHIVLSNGWTVKIGRGFDIYQRPDDWLHIGASDMDLRPCMETSVDIFRSK